MRDLVTQTLAERSLAAECDEPDELEAMFVSVSLGDTTAEYWYDVIEQTIDVASEQDNLQAVEALRALKRALQHALRVEAKFVAVSRRIAHQRIRQHCCVSTPRRLPRARARRRRSGSRLAAKAASTGDPDPEPDSASRSSAGGAL